MAESYKEQLSNHVEDIFKQYITPGLHICDIATGGGKSYTIGKLVCEYYPDYFDRIIILCVQNKLIDSMDKEIKKFIGSEKSKIKSTDILIIENNFDVIKNAIDNNSFKSLLEEIQNKLYNDNKDLQFRFNTIKKIYDGLEKLFSAFKNIKSSNNPKNGGSDYLKKQIEETERQLRTAISIYFGTYKRLYERESGKKLTLQKIKNDYPTLFNVYPQIGYKTKRILLTTVHKAMYGIDPILSDTIKIVDLADAGAKKKSLVIFDESDQAAIYMRDVIFEQSINKIDGNNRFAKGYNGYLQYKTLIDKPQNISNEYYGSDLEKSIQTAQTITNNNWNKVFNGIPPYNNIFLGNAESIENYRRGVFFSGQVFKVNVSQKTDNKKTFVCYKTGGRNFRLIHCNDEQILEKEYQIVVPLNYFLSTINGNLVAIKSQFRKVITNALENSRAKFEEEVRKVSENKSDKNDYLGYPTLEREIHTLFSRFETTSEYQFEQQINEFITNRKNIKSKDNTLKLPDWTVYSQGVQLYLEEIDELDNQHRVKLSCREINTTPEKILIDIVNSDKTSVVLCSATASNLSVMSNFDILYLKRVLGNKVTTLSKKDALKFDELVLGTYPKEHEIEIVGIEHYQNTEKRENHIVLPEKYKQMFPIDAQHLAEKWFKITKKAFKTKEEMSFQFYRLFQFIEVYSWFIQHKEIHSMIYFQNRRGDKDKNQINVLSCLIDGSFKNMKTSFDDEIPSDWKNVHIQISNDWEDLQQTVLSELSSNKDSKIMLISAYASFKAGTNMQYTIPKGLTDYVKGDNWEQDTEKLKKDWDAVYLQSPTAYLMMTDVGIEQSFEKELYNVMLGLMMLYERSCLDKQAVASWLNIAMSGDLRFSEKNNLGILKDKASWVQTIVEQAVGRLCRTKNKPKTTYILYDETMSPFFEYAQTEKSLTQEYKKLHKYIINQTVSNQNKISVDETIRKNDAEYAQNQLSRIRSTALRYSIHNYDNAEFDEDIDDGEDIPHFVKVCQVMLQSFKRTILKKPIIIDLNSFDEDDMCLPFISKCYGNWNRNDILPSSVRFDVLMKNDVIRNYFLSKGYATDWNSEGLILHPQIINSEYAGEIGEEAFKALVLYYTDCKEEDLKHLEGKDYELADFVIYNPDGSYQIAFDVKNYNPNIEHSDKPNDISTTEKRMKKIERLGCELITVNLLKIEEPLMDAIREIGGLIDNNGRIINEAIDRIKQLINLN